MTAVIRLLYAQMATPSPSPTVALTPWAKTELAFAEVRMLLQAAGWPRALCDLVTAYLDYGRVVLVSDAASRNASLATGKEVAVKPVAYVFAPWEEYAAMVEAARAGLDRLGPEALADWSATRAAHLDVGAAKWAAPPTYYSDAASDDVCFLEEYADSRKHEPGLEEGTRFRANQRVLKRASVLGGPTRASLRTRALRAVVPSPLSADVAFHVDHNSACSDSPPSHVALNRHRSLELDSKTQWLPAPFETDFVLLWTRTAASDLVREEGVCGASDARALPAEAATLHALTTEVPGAPCRAEIATWDCRGQLWKWYKSALDYVGAAAAAVLADGVHIVLFDGIHRDSGRHAVEVFDTRANRWHLLAGDRPGVTSPCITQCDGWLVWVEGGTSNSVCMRYLPTFPLQKVAEPFVLSLPECRTALLPRKAASPSTPARRAAIISLEAHAAEEDPVAKLLSARIILTRYSGSWATNAIFSTPSLAARQAQRSVYLRAATSASEHTEDQWELRFPEPVTPPDEETEWQW